MPRVRSRNLELSRYKSSICFRPLHANATGTVIAIHNLSDQRCQLRLDLRVITQNAWSTCYAMSEIFR